MSTKTRRHHRRRTSYGVYTDVYVPVHLSFDDTIDLLCEANTGNLQVASGSVIAFSWHVYSLKPLRIPWNGS